MPLSIPPRQPPYLLYLDYMPPVDHPGTPITILRHMRRFKASGWRVGIASGSWAVEHWKPSPEWETLTQPFRGRWWPPHRDAIPGSARIRAELQAIDFADRLRHDIPDLILSTLSPDSAPVAARVAKRLGRPLALVIHDQPELAESLSNRPLTQRRVRRRAQATLSQACRIYPVTEALSAAYGPAVLSRSMPLLPIPAGVDAGVAMWRDAYERPHIVHAGSLHPFQRPNFERLARALEPVGGRLTIISHHSLAPFEDLAREFDHVTLLPAFPSSDDVLAYCLAEASAILVSYSFSEQPWAATSFPSKLVEFSHLGLPTLLLAPPHAAASVWAREFGWTSRIEALDQESLTAEVAALAVREGWERRACDTRRAADGPFDPDQIHAGFEHDLRGLLETWPNSRADGLPPVR